MSQHEDQARDEDPAGARRKPWDDAQPAPAPPAEPGGYRDPQVAALVARGELDAARQHLFARVRSAPDEAAVYEDVIRLEHAHGGSVWQGWVMRGLAACSELAPRLFACLPEGALVECAVRQMLPWNALRGQHDVAAAHRLFALRVGALLWRGQVDDAFAAVIEPAWLERAAHDEGARALIVAVLTTFAWRDAARTREVAPALGVPLPDPDPDSERLPPYPLDVLEHAVLLGEPLRRACQRASCPPALLRAVELGPFFGGARARALLDELAAALRQRPDEALRFCDAAVESSGALAIYLSDALHELAHETAGARSVTASEHAARAIEELARAERRRRATALLALATGAACAAFFAWKGQLDLAPGLGAPFVLGGWALLGFLRDLAYLPRMRPALARALVHGARGASELLRELAARRELTWTARRARRDEALLLLGALAARPGGDQIEE